MSNTKEVYLTLDGLNKLKEELNYLKVEKRAEVINALKDARALGDLSENAEYDAARNEQAEIEGRIQQLEKLLENVEIIDETNQDKNSVNIGCTVAIKYVDEPDEIEEYQIVGSQEADPFAYKISNESPIARALMSRKVGDIVDVESPNGVYQIEITSIN